MKNFIRNLLIATLLRLHVPHRIVYAGLSACYLGSYVGIDKAAITGLLAFGYLLLAASR